MTTVSGGCQGNCFCGGKWCKRECFGVGSDIVSVGCQGYGYSWECIVESSKGFMLGTVEVLFESCFNLPEGVVGGVGDSGLGVRVRGVSVSTSPVRVIYGIQNEGLFGVVHSGVRKDYTVGKRLFSDKVEGKYLIENLAAGDSLVRHFGFQVSLMGVKAEDVKESDLEILGKVADALGLALIDSEESQRELFLSGYVVSRPGEILGTMDIEEEYGLRIFGLTGSSIGDDVASLSSGYLNRVWQDFGSMYDSLLSRLGYSKDSNKVGKKSSIDDKLDVDYRKFDESKSITEELKQCSEYGIWRRG